MEVRPKFSNYFGRSYTFFEKIQTIVECFRIVRSKCPESYIMLQQAPKYFLEQLWNSRISSQMFLEYYQTYCSTMF